METKLIERLKRCIFVDFEHAQYRLAGPGVGIGSSVRDALDDALFNLAETRHGALSNFAENKYVVAAFEQLIAEHSDSQDEGIGYRIYWTSERPTEFDMQVETINFDRALSFAIDEQDDVQIFDGLVWSADDLPEEIPDDIRRKINDSIQSDEHFFYVDIDEQEIQDLLIDYAEERAVK